MRSSFERHGTDRDTAAQHHRRKRLSDRWPQVTEQVSRHWPALYGALVATILFLGLLIAAAAYALTHRF